MNPILTDNEFSSDDESENSNPNKGVNYMAFTSVVKSEAVEVSETLEDIEQTNILKE